MRSTYVGLLAGVFAILPCLSGCQETHNDVDLGFVDDLVGRSLSFVPTINDPKGDPKSQPVNVDSLPADVEIFPFASNFGHVMVTTKPVRFFSNAEASVTELNKSGDNVYTLAFLFQWTSDATPRDDSGPDPQKRWKYVYPKSKDTTYYWRSAKIRAASDGKGFTISGLAWRQRDDQDKAAEFNTPEIRVRSDRPITSYRILGVPIMAIGLFNAGPAQDRYKGVVKLTPLR
jgi:hypothetical protein